MYFVSKISVLGRKFSLKMGDNEVMNEAWPHLMAVDDSLELKGIQKLTYHFLLRHEYRCTLASPVPSLHSQRQGFCAVEKAAFLIHVHVASSCFNDVVCMYVKSIRM